MKNIIITGTIAVASVFIYSCNKSEDNSPVNTASLTVVSPVPNQEFSTGDTVHIHGTATNVVALHGYHTYILNRSGDTLFEADEHNHAVQLDIDQEWIDTLSTPQDLSVVVSATIDHDGNELKKEIAIKTRH